MIRSGIPLRLALMAGLFLPSFAEAQDAKPADGKPPIDVNAAYQEATKAATEARAAAKRAAEEASKAQAAQADAFRQKADALKKSLTQADPKFPTPAQTRVYTTRRPGQAPKNRTIVRLAGVDPLEAKFGMVMAGADDALRAQLAIPAGEGVVVVSVKAQGLADQGGLKSNDVVTALGDEPARSVEQARAKLLGIGKGAIPLKLIREGKPRQISLVGPEHGTPEEAADYWIGVPVTPVDATLRSHVQGLPEGVGLVANDVVADSPAAKAGLKKYDILISLGKKPLKDSESLIAAVQASQGKPVALEIARAGQVISLDVTPVRREQSKVAGMVVAPVETQWVEMLTKQLGPLKFEANVNFDTEDWSKVQPLTFQYTSSIDPAKVEELVRDIKAIVEDLKKQVESMKKPDGK